MKDWKAAVRNWSRKDESMSELKRTNFQAWAQSAQSYDPLAFAKLKADCFNKEPGNLTGADCPKCKNKE